MSGIPAACMPGILGGCEVHLINVINCICAYINSPERAVISMFFHVRRSIHKNVVWIWDISICRN